MKKIGSFLRKYGFYMATGVICIGALVAIFLMPNQEGNIKNEANPYAKYIYGESSSVFVYFCQAVQLNILGLLVFAGFKLFTKKTTFEIVLSITLFGTFLFLLIWETRSRYLVLMLPVMIAMCTYGMCDKSNEWKD